MIAGRCLRDELAELYRGCSEATLSPPGGIVEQQSAQVVENPALLHPDPTHIGRDRYFAAPTPPFWSPHPQRQATISKKTSNYALSTFLKTQSLYFNRETVLGNSSV